MAKSAVPEHLVWKAKGWLQDADYQREGWTFGQYLKDWYGNDDYGLVDMSRALIEAKRQVENELQDWIDAHECQITGGDSVDVY